MTPGDLTTLNNVKSWLGISGSTDDALLQRLISAQSRFIQSWLNRRIALQQYTEVRSGVGMGGGKYVMLFNNPPVSSVTSISVDGVVIPASIDGGVLQPGYGFDSEQIWISPASIVNRFTGNGFSRGKFNVTLMYKGGFLVMPSLSIPNDDSGLLPAEQVTIPQTTPEITTAFTVLSDNGVATLAGVSLTKVASAPATGQYSFGKDGAYSFNVADANTDVLLSYSYVPPDIEQACVELVAMRYKEKDRIGQVSKAVGQETISYSQKSMPNDVGDILNQYRRLFSF